MRTTSVHPRALILLTALALALFVAGCGESSDTSAEPTSGVSGASVTATDDSGMSMDDHEEDEDHEGVAFGEPADASEADRTIQVAASDEFAFDPAEIEVAADETITFEITNTGAIVHEFVIGDEHTQEAHEEEMAEMSEGEMMHDEPNAVDVEPGETASITWHFTEPGEVLYGCHEAGHYGAGMVGTITVS